jgi:hypothetical protein
VTEGSSEITTSVCRPCLDAGKVAVPTATEGAERRGKRA